MTSTKTIKISGEEIIQLILKSINVEEDYHPRSENIRWTIVHEGDPDRGNYLEWVKEVSIKIQQEI